MGLDYICKPNLKLAIVVWDGTVNLDQWQQNLHRRLADPEYALAKYQLADIRFTIADSSINDQTIKSMVEFMATQRAKVAGKKIAMVSGDEWELLKRFETLMLEAALATPIVFNDLQRACLWLGVNVAEIGQEIEQIRLKLRQNP